jgi:23S rRNA-/tRNA-specific pseudouridylate synthase
MKAISHPVVCDKLYAPKREPALGFQRLALHALSIYLELPDGKKVNIESELPPDFVNAENLL